MCTKAVLNEITTQVALEAKRQLGDKLDKVILYGSYARGDYDEESDIDIMVLADIPAEDRWKTRLNLGGIISELGLEHDILISMNVVDCATFYKHKDSLPYYQNAVRDGVILSA